MIMDKIMYEDLKNARKINSIIDVIKALESTGENKKLVKNLKASIGYDKNGQVKRKVEFYEIAPTVSLDPPGTLGFKDLEAIKKIMHIS